MSQKKSRSKSTGAKPQRKPRSNGPTPKSVVDPSVDPPVAIPSAIGTQMRSAELDELRDTAEFAPTEDLPPMAAESTPPRLAPAASPLRSTKHEKFAQYVAEGLSAVDAHRHLYPTAKSDAQCRYAYACRIRARPDVAARIAWLQSQAATDTIMNLREILLFLTAVKRTPIGKVTADSELAERFEETTTGVKKVWMPDKRACVELFAKLQGMLVDRSKVQHSGEIEHTLGLSETLRNDLMDRRQRALDALPPIVSALPET
jgi:hypothetical protein